MKNNASFVVAVAISSNIEMQETLRGGLQIINVAWGSAVGPFGGQDCKGRRGR